MHTHRRVHCDGVVVGKWTKLFMQDAMRKGIPLVGFINVPIDCDLPALNVDEFFKQKWV